MTRTPLQRQWWPRCVAFLVLLAVCLCANAEERRLGIVVGGDNFDYQAIARRFGKALQERLGAATPSIEVLKPSHPLAADRYDLLLSLGSKAAARALDHRGNSPLLCALISRDAFLATLEQKGLATDSALRQGIAVLYLDQPTQRIFDLAHLVVPRARLAGTVMGPILQHQETDLVTDARRAGLSLKTSTLTGDENPVSALNSLVGAVDVVVALPDKVSFNRQAARWLLYLSFHRQVPLVAYSRRYTEAGALASVYSASADVAREAAAISTRMLEQPGTGDIYWPGTFRVSVNHKVARNLHLDVRTGEYYATELAKLEKER